MTSPNFPETPTSIPATSIASADVVVERVAAKKQAWLAVALPERIALLQQCLAGVAEVASDWVREMCKVKGLSPDESLAGEEWLAGPVTTARNMRLLIDVAAAGGQPKPPAVRTRPAGQHVARVFPADTHDKLMFAGHDRRRVDRAGQAGDRRAHLPRARRARGSCCLVLGAGNVSSIPPMDVALQAVRRGRGRRSSR